LFRVQILEVVSALLELGLTSVAYSIIETNFLVACWDIIFKFEVNSFCHRNVEKITILCLELLGGESQIKILKSTKLIDKIITAEDANTKAISSGKSRQPNMPYLHSVGRMIQLIASTNESVRPVVEAVGGWSDYSAMLDAEKKKLDEICSAKNIGGDDEANIFKPGQHYGDIDAESEAYTEGHDADADDLALPDNVDMDSANDFDDYDIDHAEVLLRKEEIEAFS